MCEKFSNCCNSLTGIGDCNKIPKVKQFGSISPPNDPNKLTKLRMDLIPAEAIFALAEVLTHGADKHGERDWEEHTTIDEHFAAAQRHLWKAWNEETIDPEFGLPHVYHAFCRLAMWIALYKRNK